MTNVDEKKNSTEIYQTIPLKSFENLHALIGAENRRARLNSEGRSSRREKSICREIYLKMCEDFVLIGLDHRRVNDRFEHAMISEKRRNFFCVLHIRLACSMSISFPSDEISSPGIRSFVRYSSVAMHRSLEEVEKNRFHWSSETRALAE